MTRRLVSFLLLLLFVPSLSYAERLTVRINQGIDDVEEATENGAKYGVGYVFRTSGDLELTDDTNWIRSEQIVGLRFRNITIPEGSTITNAFIRFKSFYSSSGDCALQVEGQSHNNAPEFLLNDYNVSNRTPTGASVPWYPGNWNNNNVAHDTPSLKDVVQEIIDVDGWESGNSMVFMVSGSGRRVAYSYEQKKNRAALLVVDYEEVPTVQPPIITVMPELSVGTDTNEGTNAPSRSFVITNTGGSELNFNISDDQSWLECTPATGDLPAGESITITVTYTTSTLDPGTYDASIEIDDDDDDNDGSADSFDYNASLRVTPVLTGSACGDVPVYTENLVNPAILLLLDVSGSMGWQAPLVAAEDNNSHTPDLSSIVQQIVDRDAWVPGNAMSFIIANGNGRRVAVSRDASSDLAPLLHIEYSGTVVEARIENSSDDAEEESNGDVTLTSSDLDFDDGDYDWVGLRFVDLDIPQGSIITNAYIELVVDEDDSSTTNVTIWGENIDNAPTFTIVDDNISDRSMIGGIQWNDIESWDSAPTDMRINIAKDVLSELVKDRSIAWGFGTWTGNNTSYHEYTRIHVGTRYNDDEHQQHLQDAIAAAFDGGNTPLTPSLRAGRDYFDGDTEDEVNDEIYYDPGCQPKIVIEITDGIGNTGTTLANVTTTTKVLTDAKISVVGVGFGLNDASQLNALARVSNEEGEASDDDDIYALHKENSDGHGIPFLANSKDELIEALNGITASLKSQVFYGAAPAATTSVGYDNIMIYAQFSPDDWSGDLIAKEYDYGSGILGSLSWSASTVMPLGNNINAFTLDNSDDVIEYSDSPLNQFYLCKPLGDIVNSTPKVVGGPAFYYVFDDYYAFVNERRDRTKLVYVGANDGALHAFNLGTGIEAWRFYPKSIQSHLNSNLVDTSEDFCYSTRTPSGEYCHKYLVDGSPIAADVYDGTDWSTVLVTGLGKGGSAYFALDVTGGGTFGGGDDDTKFLWEFTDSDLGLATSEPAIGRVEGSSSPKWGVFIGSGYSDTDQSTKEAYLFGFNVRDQSALWEDSSGTSIKKLKISSSTLLNDALATPLLADIGDTNLGDHLYTGNLYGTMFRVSNLGEEQTPEVSRLLDLGRAGHENPITASAAYTYDETDENIWIYFGTGKYDENSDKTTMSQQYIFGLKENEVLGAAAESSNDATYFWNAATNTIGSPSSAIKELSMVDLTVVDEDGVSRTYNVIDDCSATESAWLLRLADSEPGMIGSERITSKPIVVGGVVYFTTFIPDIDVCAGNGQGRLYALNYKTGCSAGAFDPPNVPWIPLPSGKPSKPVFDGKHIIVGSTDEEPGPITGAGNDDTDQPLKSWREL